MIVRFLFNVVETVYDFVLKNKYKYDESNSIVFKFRNILEMLCNDVFASRIIFYRDMRIAFAYFEHLVVIEVSHTTQFLIFIR